MANRVLKVFSIVLFFLAIVTIVFLSILLKGQLIINQISSSPGSFIELKPAKFIPYYNPNRINILLLGIRGIGDPYGGALTDTIMVASFRKDTDRVALISIPRDLYVKLILKNGKVFEGKINEAYVFGREQGGELGGLSFAKEVVSYISGLKIDYALRADMDALKEVVDTLGGIDIYLKRPFSERSQWRGEGGFFLPAGKNSLNGDQALYYIRSRYSTSDFDRARRQQQVLLAIKDKVMSLGFLSNPVKIYSLINLVGNHVRTDIPSSQIKYFLKLVSNIKISQIIHKVFDTSSAGHLYATYKDKRYILLPVGGTFDAIRKDCRNIFNSSQ